MQKEATEYRDKPGQKEYLPLHTDIRELVAFCIGQRLLGLNVREWLGSILYRDSL